jgi:hypothetical protein
MVRKFLGKSGLAAPDVAGDGDKAFGLHPSFLSTSCIRRKDGVGQKLSLLATKLGEALPQARCFD